jgi:glycosyltransferase involved in cell wall biosynthesis
MAEIVLASQQVGHYTGGRVYAFQLACALGELGHDVTIQVDARRMPFEKDYGDYMRPDVVTGMGYAQERADVYIGLPVNGAVQACNLARMQGVPAIVCILDVLPMMRKYRKDQGVVNMHEHIWRGMADTIRAARDWVHVFVLAECNREPCAQWLGLPMDRVHTIYPAVNHRALNKAPQRERLNSICWISRIVGHKKFPHVLDAVKLLGLSVDVITAKPDVRMVKHRGVDHLVRWHLRISDAEKFEILKRSAAMVNASVFEGFGMFFIEALAAGTPPVVYRFPTYEEVVGEFRKYTYFAKLDDREDLQVQLMKCLRDGKAGFEGDTRFSMNRMIKDLAITMQKIL